MKAEIIESYFEWRIFMERKNRIIKGTIDIFLKMTPISNVTKTAPRTGEKLTICAKIQHQWSENKLQPIQAHVFQLRRSQTQIVSGGSEILGGK